MLEVSPSAANLYTLLYIDDFRLAFAQHQVAMVELASAIRADDKPSLTVGTLVLQQSRLPVYAPDPNLSLTKALPLQRRFCVCFNPGGDAGGAFALACDHVETQRIATGILPIPGCLRAENNPLQQMVKQLQTLVFISTAAAMKRYINTLEQSG